MLKFLSLEAEILYSGMTFAINKIKKKKSIDQADTIWKNLEYVNKCPMLSALTKDEGTMVVLSEDNPQFPILFRILRENNHNQYPEQSVN